MTPKHTLGDWEVDYSGPARLEIRSGEKSIALCNMQCEDGEQDEANAKLIAAAPELLFACKAALAGLKDPDFDCYFGAELLETVIESAIEKATGKAVAS